MRNALIILLLIAGFLLSGIIVVDQREVVTVQNQNKITLFAPGIHWKLPFSGKVDFVYTNLRTSYLTIAQALQFPEQDQVQIGVIVDWQVVNPAQYVKYTSENTLKGFDVKLVNLVTANIESLAQSSNSLKDFESQLNFKAHNILFGELGIDVVNIALVNVSSVTQQPIANGKESDLIASYTLAQQIKGSADQEQLQSLAKLRKQDSNLFDYYMKIRHYQETARTKGEVPPLAQIYPH